MSAISSDDENVDMSTEYTKVKEAYVELQDYCQKLNEDINSIRQENEILLAKTTTMENEKKELEGELNQLKDQLQSVTSEKKEMQDQIDSAEVDKDSSKSKYQKLVSDISSLEEELASVKQERDTLKTELDDMKNTQSNNYDQAIESPEVNELKNTISSLEEEKATMTMKVDELIEQLKLAQEREEELQKRVESPKSENTIDKEEVQNEQEFESEEGKTRTSVGTLKDLLESGDSMQNVTHDDLVALLKEKQNEIANLKEELGKTKQTEEVQESPVEIKSGKNMNRLSYCTELEKIRNRLCEIESRLQ